MSLLEAIYILIMNLPRILRLLEQMQKRQTEAATDRKVKEDLEDITKAFQDNDEEALRRIFNSK